MFDLSRRRFLELLGVGAAAAALPAVAEAAPVLAPEIAPAVAAARGPITHTVSMFVKNADLSQLARNGWTISPAGNGWGHISRGLTAEETNGALTDEMSVYRGLTTDKGLFVCDADHEPTDGTPFTRSVSITGAQIEQNLPAPTPYIETARTNLIKRSGYDWRAEQRDFRKRRHR